THRAERFVMHGRPVSSIWTESETVEGLLNGIRKGRVVLSADPDDSFITLSSGMQGIGDTIAPVSPAAVVPLLIEASKLQGGDRISLWSDRGVEAEWTTDDEEAVFAFDGSADRLFYRVESRRYIKEMERTVMTCLTNPIYIGRSI
ncbi:hypothetical protein K0U00_39580, partial [Paenibacillus sepulcri]|nr:hypothetical protein [Paenibacillus sepulcri]